MDPQTHEILSNLNRTVADAINLVFRTLDDQQRQITAIANIIRQTYEQLTGQPLETLPMPTPEQLAKQAAEIDELKKLFGLDPDASKGE